MLFVTRIDVNARVSERTLVFHIVGGPTWLRSKLVDDNFETPDTSATLLCNLYLQERGTERCNRKKVKLLKLSAITAT